MLGILPFTGVESERSWVLQPRRICCEAGVRLIALSLSRLLHCQSTQQHCLLSAPAPNQVKKLEARNFLCLFWGPSATDVKTERRRDRGRNNEEQRRRD